MKKAISILLFVACVLFCCSCYQDLQYDSLDDYAPRVLEKGCGYSSYELDDPERFLPSATFLHDFSYVEGEYHYYENDPFRLQSHPAAVSFLRLTYEEETYKQAKAYTMEHIPAYGDQRYAYGAYIFYENARYVEAASLDKEQSRFPNWFTMVCYNDEKNVLIFMGFGEGSKISIDDWKAFIDTYFSSYYDFSE